MTEIPLREINPDPPPEPLDDAAREEIAALARRQEGAAGLLMRAVNMVGGSVEDGLRLLPKAMRDQIDRAAERALLRSYDAAARSRGLGGRAGALAALVAGDRMHKALAAATGALGGLGGLPTALAELPLATTVIFRAVQGVAEQNGEDPDAPETRMECLRVFGAGGALRADGSGSASGSASGADASNTSFLGARLSLTGVGINRLVARIAPRFGAVISQKLAAGAVPLVGAAAGAGTNLAFTGYYLEMAHVHFGLRRLARRFGEGPVLGEFHKALAELKGLPVNLAGEPR
jgi:hypothetical protein